MIIYNAHRTLKGIPPEALEYVVNGKPAIEWVMERYPVTTDKDSGIVNDPNLPSYACTGGKAAQQNLPSYA